MVNILESSLNDAERGEYFSPNTSPSCSPLNPTSPARCWGFHCEVDGLEVSVNCLSYMLSSFYLFSIPFRLGFYLSPSSSIHLMHHLHRPTRSSHHCNTAMNHLNHCPVWQFGILSADNKRIYSSRSKSYRYCQHCPIGPIQGVSVSCLSFLPSLTFLLITLPSLFPLRRAWAYRHRTEYDQPPLSPLHTVWIRSILSTSLPRGILFHRIQLTRSCYTIDAQHTRPEHNTSKYPQSYSASR